MLQNKLIEITDPEILEGEIVLYKPSWVKVFLGKVKEWFKNFW